MATDSGAKWLLHVCMSQGSVNLRTGRDLVRGVDGRCRGVARTARAAAAAVTAVGCRRGAVTAQQRIHRASCCGAIARNGMACTRTASHLHRLTLRHHFEAVYVQIVAHLTTHSYREVQQICAAEYLHIHQHTHTHTNTPVSNLTSMPHLKNVCTHTHTPF